MSHKWKDTTTPHWVGMREKKLARCTARERKGRASEVWDESERVAGVLDATQHVHMTGCFTAAHTLQLITSCKNVHDVHKPTYSMVKCKVKLLSKHTELSVGFYDNHVREGEKKVITCYLMWWCGTKGHWVWSWLLGDSFTCNIPSSGEPDNTFVAKSPTWEQQLLCSPPTRGSLGNKDISAGGALHSATHCVCSWCVWLQENE